MLRLFRLTARKYAAVRVPAAASPTHGGPQPRVESPSGGSTLTTSAPRSPRSIVQYGPARTVEQSTTRRPASGPGAAGRRGGRHRPDGSAAYARRMILPRWVFRVVWAIDDTASRLSGGRLTVPNGSRGRLRTLFLHTVGRTSGEPRRNGLYYLEDGPNLVVVASNAGDDRDPAWWRNLQARPEAEVEIGASATPGPCPPGHARGSGRALRAIRRRDPELRRVPPEGGTAHPGGHPRATLMSPRASAPERPHDAVPVDREVPQADRDEQDPTRDLDRAMVPRDQAHELDSPRRGQERQQDEREPETQPVRDEGRDARQRFQ